MRFKNRYFLCEMCWSDPALTMPALNAFALYKEVRNALLANFGEFGYGQLTQSLQCKYFNYRTNLLILRCARDDHFLVHAALSFIHSVRGHAVTIQIVHTGGTIRSCQKSAVQYTRHALLALYQKQMALRAGHAATDTAVRHELELAVAAAMTDEASREEREIQQLDT